MKWEKSETDSNAYITWIDNEEVKFSFSISPNGYTLTLATNNKKISERIINNWDQSGIWKSCYNGFILKSLVTKDKDSLTKFILGIHSVCPFKKKTLREILQQLNLIDIEAWKGRIKQFVDKGQFLEILAEILLLESDELLWTLTRYCESNEQLNEALTCYQSFSEDSRYYRLINDRASALLKHSLKKFDKGPITLTEEEKLPYYEYLVRFSLRNNNTQSADDYYHKLSGGGLTLAMITGVKVDEDTLIKIAYHIRYLRNENAQLKNEVASLKSKSNNDEKEEKRPEFTIATKKFPGFLHQNSKQTVNGNDQDVSLLHAKRRSSI